MITRQHYYKACHAYINHTPIVKTLNIRLQYRVYLAEMEAYRFNPLSFREWHRYFIAE